MPPPPLCSGQCQFCEPTGLANVADIFHVNTVGQLLMSFDVSSSKQALAFGDSGGCVHLWSDAPEVSFNDYSRETEFALPCLVDTLPQLDWNHDLLPLSLIPMPLTSTEPLLSDWPAALATPSPRSHSLTHFISVEFVSMWQHFRNINSGREVNCCLKSHHFAKHMVVKKASELKPFALTQNKYILFLFTQHAILTCSEVHLYWKLMSHSQNREVGNYRETD